ncbi:MAG: hypothetical protein AAGN66_23165 [Acidobacteriota bacterium]
MLSNRHPGHAWHFVLAALSSLTFAIPTLGAPPVPGQATAACGAVAAGKCYVNGSFTLTTSSPGAHHYRVCRSHDVTGWGGCSNIFAPNTQMPATVAGSDIPGDGFRRAYYVSACDAGNSCTPFGSNSPTYVYGDFTPPTAPGASTTRVGATGCAVGATGPSGCWLDGAAGSFTVQVAPATDGGSGVGAYQHCRSENSTGGFAGCDDVMTSTGGTSFTVTGTHLPPAGVRRAYWVRARDRVGNWGPWNSPAYVRLDRNDPVVSASGSSPSWTTAASAVVSAQDTTGDAIANSGLAQVRYRWNQPLDAACTQGTATTNGATLTAPSGDNRLYLCARDYTGRVGTWNAAYRVDPAPPQQVSLTQPDPVWVIDDGSTYDITVRVDEATSGIRDLRTSINLHGSNVANRRGQFAWHTGVYVWTADRVACAGGGFGSKHPTSLNPGTVQLVGCATSVSGDRRTVTFTVRPNTSFGELAAINDISAWAKDLAGNRTGWRSYDLDFRSRKAVDVEAPTPETLTVSSSTWRVDRSQTYDLVATATDLGSGVREIRALINHQGGNAGQYRGFFSWREPGSTYAFQKDQIPCVGGGWGSMHSFRRGSSRTTLVGCSTTLIDGVRRRVTFTVRPNETFGVFGPVHDISMRTWDFDDNAPPWTNFDTNFASIRPNDTLGRSFGYAGIRDAAELQDSIDNGVGIDLATLVMLRRTCAPRYWKTFDSAAVMDAYAAQNAKAMVILENFLFKDVNNPSAYNDDCDDTTPAPPPGTSACFQDQKWELLDDWMDRLDLFESLHGSRMTPDKVEFFLISSEVNDRCFDLDEVEQVAQEVKRRYPAIPVAFFYGATYDRLGQRASQPPPVRFPAVFDVVGLFSYDIFDLIDPHEARNSTGTYYNPEQPNDPNTIYGDLLDKLLPHQEVLLIFDADYSGTPDPCVDPNTPPSGGNAAQGWCRSDLDQVAQSYAEFMSFRPEVTILGGVSWQAMLALPPNVRDHAAQMACAYFDNDSPLCP